MSAIPLTYAHGDGSVACRYGLEEAVFLDTVIFWWRTNKSNNCNFYDGRWWTYNSVKTFETLFPWWSGKQLRRIINNCKEKGALLIGNYNEDQRDRTQWYSPSDELLELYGESGTSNLPNGKINFPERAETVAQTGEPLPCPYHDTTSTYTLCSPPGVDGAARPVSKPISLKGGKDKALGYNLDWFDAFWAKYPRKDKKQAALRAWNRLRPDKPTCRRMSAALELAKRSRQWLEESGRYIPLPSTWLNGREWENEGVDLSLLAQPPEDLGGWADDPEVTG